MSKELVSDELWDTIEPLLPKEPPKPQGGRPRIDDRAALAGIVFVLKGGTSPGRCSPRRWAVDRVRRAGDTCATGRRQECGKHYSGCTWTRRVCRQKGGTKNQPESDG